MATSRYMVKYSASSPLARRTPASLVGEILPGVLARFVRIETLIQMKEATGREKDREDVRQLRRLLDNPDDAH